MSDQPTEKPTRIKDLFLSLLLYPLPHHWISRVVYFFARLRTGFKNPVIRWFVRQFQVDLAEAIYSKPEDYIHFNDFFTRKLKPNARPIADGEQALISPVDGRISQIGSIDAGTIVQAKGHNYSVAGLLGEDKNLAKQFHNGSFTTLYLSPRDYHRIHMPLAGNLQKMIYVPGRLFSVAPHTVRAIPKLFARNERVVCIFDSARGLFSLILVGAINVAAIETVWHGLVTPPHHRRIAVTDYNNSDIQLAKADEMGRFNMGSTVILLTSRTVEWLPEFKPGKAIKFGQRLAVAP